MALANLDRTLNQRRIRGRKRAAIKPHIVLKTRAGMAAGTNRPVIDDDLMWANTGGTPFASWHQALDGLDIIVEDMLVGGDQRIDHGRA